MKNYFLVFFLISQISGCLSGKPDQIASKEDTLEGKFGAKKLYLWSRPVDPKKSGSGRSCWYYKEVSPAMELTEQDALIRSNKLNDYSIIDSEFRSQLDKLVMEKLLGAGVDFAPCGLGAISFASMAATAGTAALALGVSAGFLAHSCFKNYEVGIIKLKEWRGAGDAVGSLRNGETDLGSMHPASKWELDMFREAIRRTVSLGYELKPSCLAPKEFKQEILKKT